MRIVKTDEAGKSHQSHPQFTAGRFGVARTAAAGVCKEFDVAGTAPLRRLRGTGPKAGLRRNVRGAVSALSRCISRFAVSRSTTEFPLVAWSSGYESFARMARAEKSRSLSQFARLIINRVESRSRCTNHGRAAAGANHAH